MNRFLTLTLLTIMAFTITLTNLTPSTTSQLQAQVVDVDPVDIPDGADPFDYWIFRAGCSWGSAEVNPFDLLDDAGNPQDPREVARRAAEWEAITRANTAYQAAVASVPPNFTIVTDEPPEIDISVLSIKGNGIGRPGTAIHVARACWTVVARRTAGEPGDPGDIPVDIPDDVFGPDGEFEIE